MNTKLNLSPSGLAMLKRLEGVRYSAYRDSAGLWTTGVGHLIRPDEMINLCNRVLTPVEVDALLYSDIKNTVNCVNGSVLVNLAQHQFDALVMFTFNVGTTAFKGSSLLVALNAGKYETAGNKLLDWNKITTKGKLGKPVKIVSDGLNARRIRERELFLSGVYWA